MYNVHCIMYIVHCTLYIVHCTMYNVHCTMYNVRYIIYIIHCTMYGYIYFCNSLFIYFSISYDIIFTWYLTYCNLANINNYYISFVIRRVYLNMYI